MAISIDALLDKIALPTIGLQEKMQLVNYLRTSPDYSKAEKRKLYTRLDNDSEYFANVCFSHVLQGKSIPDFHKDIYSSLDDTSLTYLGIIVFRQAAKSTIKVIKVCQLACTQKTKYTLLISETEDQALDDVRTIKDEFESNEMIKMLYFNGKSAAGEIWATGTIVLSNGVCIKAKGMNSRMRGLKYKFQRPDHVMLDDFESEDNSSTEEGRADVRNKISAVIIPLGDVITRYCFFNTLPNDQCFMSSELANPNGIFTAESNGKIIKYQITTFIDGVEHPTWSRYDWDWIRAKKRYYEARKEIHIWLQEYYNIPGNKTNPKFDMNMVKELDAIFDKHDYVKYIQMPDGKKIPVTTFIGVDPASTTNKRSDNTVIFSIAVMPSGNIVILEVRAEKIKITEQPQEIMKSIIKYRADHTTIETINAQLNVYQYTEKMMEDTGEFFPLAAFNDTKSKNNKFIDGLEPVINTGKLSYIKGCVGIDTFFNEAKCFSGGKREHDDTLDGLYLALLNMWIPGDMDVDEYIDFFTRQENTTDIYEKNPTLEWVCA